MSPTRVKIKANLAGSENSDQVLSGNSGHLSVALPGQRYRRRLGLCPMAFRPHRFAVRSPPSSADRSRRRAH